MHRRWEYGDRPDVFYKLRQVALSQRQRREHLICASSQPKILNRRGRGERPQSAQRVFACGQQAGMLPTMSATQVRRPIITIAGPGSLGNALAISLHAAGYRISEILSRAGKASRRRARALARKVGACAAVIGKEPCNADVLWLCVPDREIRNCAEFLARSGGWSKRAVLHSSGALTSDELAALRSRGASVASVHPLMTFVPGEIPSLAGVPFAIEGDWTATRVARRIARHLGGEPFQISKADKTAYHAWGAFTSPLLTALLVTAEQVAAAARIPRRRARKMMLPILRQTLANYASFGGPNGFSGPIVRGDIDTVKRHLRALESTPVARKVYAALAQGAIEYLPTKNKTGLRHVIERALRR
ncbi:MAG: DUF2520 domain-containing protein [Acidobacteria bacterium]|nr:MAG: DUF2520 domain-containing protein [Acidobacteriota bacterium]